MKRLIAGGDERHGSGTATSTLHPTYDGACRMSYRGRMGVRKAVVFPNISEAALAANFAIQPDHGGYYTAELTEAAGVDVTHLSCMDWIASEKGFR